MTTIDLSRHLPCGFPVKTEETILAGMMGVSIGLTIPLFVRILNARDDLFTYHFGQKRIYEGAVMADFIGLVEHAFLGFFLAMLLALILGIYHYAYHYQGSKSIYLMRRLPSAFELHRRCWSVPLAAIVIYAAALILLFLLYFAFYLLITPEGCLAPNQWQKIWSVIL